MPHYPQNNSGEMREKESEEACKLNFKTEIFLLLTSIVLFVASTVIYSSGGVTFGLPYKSYAFSFVGFGTVLMVAASVSFSRRSKKTR